MRKCCPAHFDASYDGHDGEEEQEGDHPEDEELARQDLGVFAAGFAFEIGQTLVAESRSRAEPAASRRRALIRIDTELSLERIALRTIIPTNATIQQQSRIPTAKTRIIINIIAFLTLRRAFSTSLPLVRECLHRAVIRTLPIIREQALSTRKTVLIAISTVRADIAEDIGAGVFRLRIDVDGFGEACQRR